MRFGCLLHGATLVEEGKQKLTMSGPASPGNALESSVPFTSSVPSSASSSSVPFAVSVPSSANADVGKNALRKELRSVVMNKVAFEMCKYFNEQQVMPVEQELEVSEMCDNVFKQVVSLAGKPTKKTTAEQNSSKPPRSPSPSPPRPSEHPEPSMTENQITKALAQRMNEFITTLDVQDQSSLSELVNSKQRVVGRTDITFVETQTNEQRERTLVALLEVGIETTKDLNDFSLWMSKLGQGVAYLKKITKDTVTVPVSTKNVVGDLKLSKPALLAIVTFDKHQTRMNVGVFCCERREHGSIRMALMYRQQTKGEGEMTQAFGKIIKGIVALGSTRDSLLETDDFVYLGPNCALREGRVSFNGRVGVLLFDE
jgi:ribosome-binding protein aMBF1 (putative translation factor)